MHESEPQPEARPPGTTCGTLSPSPFATRYGHFDAGTLTLSIWCTMSLGAGGIPEHEFVPSFTDKKRALRRLRRPPTRLLMSWPATRARRASKECTTRLVTRHVDLQDRPENYAPFEGIGLGRRCVSAQYTCRLRRFPAPRTEPGGLVRVRRCSGFGIGMFNANPKFSPPAALSLRRG